MSVEKENHDWERLVHCSTFACCHGPSIRGSVAAAPACTESLSASVSVWSLQRRPDSEDTYRWHQWSAECRCGWPRSVTSPAAGLAGSPGHGPGRPARPAGAECCGTPGRGAERPTPAPARRRLRPPAALRHLVLLLLLSSVFRIAEGCSSRANPKPRGPSPSTRRPYTFNTEPCPAMYQELYCLNGAKCFKVNIGHNPLYNCECADGFMGQRCEFKDPDGSYSHLRRPGRPARPAPRSSLPGRRPLSSADLLLLRRHPPDPPDPHPPDPGPGPPSTGRGTSARPPPVSMASSAGSRPDPASRQSPSPSASSSLDHSAAVRRQTLPPPPSPSSSATSSHPPPPSASPSPPPTPTPTPTPPPTPPPPPPLPSPSAPYARGSGSRDAIVEQASIAGGAGVALLVCLLLSGLLYVWSKRRRKSAASTGQLTPRFGLRQSTSHVVLMEPPSPAAVANQPPGAADVIELQPADRWTQPPPPAAQTAPEDTQPAVAAAAAAGGATPGPDASKLAQTAPTEPQSRQSDRPP